MMQRMKNREASRGGYVRRCGRADSRDIQWCIVERLKMVETRTPGASYACRTQMVGEKEAVEETLAGTFEALTGRGACRKPPIMSWPEESRNVGDWVLAAQSVMKWGE
jgi:hypothetical protein